MSLANIYFLCFLSLTVKLYLLSYSMGKGIKTAYFPVFVHSMIYSFYNLRQ